MTTEELNKILMEHKLWLDSDWTKGKQADLSYENLSDFDLKHADLRHAILKGTILSGADLRDANLKSVNLTDANLKDVNLSGANLSVAILYDTNLSGANLSGADLSDADMYCANLFGANLRHTNLSGTNLNGADLNATFLDEAEQLRQGVILQEKMVGWKKCRNNVLVKLEIPKGAIVFSINNKKCRTNIAKVVEIIGGDGKSAISKYDEEFIYKLGEAVEVKDFDCRYNVECGTGIHFFRTKEEAIAY